MSSYTPTLGKDGDAVDVIIGPHPESELVHVINQVDPSTGAFDEHKVVLGALSRQEAKQIYLDNYAPGWKGFGGLRQMSMPEFKEWVKRGKRSRKVHVTKAFDPSEPREADGRWTNRYPAADEFKATSDQIARGKSLGVAVPPTSWHVEFPNEGKYIVKWRDSKGRQQGIRHPHVEEEASARKFEALTLTTKMVPKLEAACKRNLALEDASRNRVIAAAALLILEGSLRVGGEEHFRTTGSMGASTLSKNNVAVNGRNVTLDFKGKEGVHWQKTVRNKLLADAVKHFMTLPGDRMFQYHARDGAFIPLTDDKVRDFFAEFGITPKQIRTYSACKTAAEFLDSAGPPKTEKEAKEKINQACKVVAEQLNNTPVMARSSYINPAILSAYAASISKGYNSMSSVKSWTHERFAQYVAWLGSMLENGTITEDDPFPEDAVKVTKGLVLLVRKAYNPNEPRDDRGRWTGQRSIDVLETEYAKALADNDTIAMQHIVNEATGVKLVDSTIKREHEGYSFHTPAAPDYGAPLWDLTGKGKIYPADVYSHKGLQYYGTGMDSMDSQSWGIAQSAKGRPNKQIRIYRAVEKDASRGIESGAWVTTVRAYAVDHGKNNVPGGYKIQTKLVTAKDIYTSGDSWLEWGYHPQPEPQPASKRFHVVRDAEGKLKKTSPYTLSELTRRYRKP